MRRRDLLVAGACWTSFVRQVLMKNYFWGGPVVFSFWVWFRFACKTSLWRLWCLLRCLHHPVLLYHACYLFVYTVTVHAADLYTTWTTGMLYSTFCMTFGAAFLLLCMDSRLYLQPTMLFQRSSLRLVCSMAARRGGDNKRGDYLGSGHDARGEGEHAFRFGYRGVAGGVSTDVSLALLFAEGRRGFGFLSA